MAKEYYIAHATSFSPGQTYYATAQYAPGQARPMYSPIISPSIRPDFVQLFKSPEEAAKAAGATQSEAMFGIIPGMRLQKVEALAPIDNEGKTRCVKVLQELDLKKYLIKVAVQDPTLLSGILKNQITDEMAREVIRGNKEFGLGLASLPRERRTPDLCLLGVQCDSEAARYVPDRCWTAEMADEVFRKDHSKFNLIPPRFRSQEMCLVYIRDYPENLKIVPEPRRTLNLCQMAVAKVPMSFRDVPRYHKSQAFCLDTVQRDPRTCFFVPPEQCSVKIHEIAAGRMPGMPSYHEWIHIQESRYPLVQDLGARINRARTDIQQTDRRNPMQPQRAAGQNDIRRVRVSPGDQR